MSNDRDAHAPEETGQEAPTPASTSASKRRRVRRGTSTPGNVERAVTKAPERR